MNEVSQLQVRGNFQEEFTVSRKRKNVSRTHLCEGPALLLKQHIERPLYFLLLLRLNEADAAITRQFAQLRAVTSTGCRGTPCVELFPTGAEAGEMRSICI